MGTSKRSMTKNPNRPEKKSIEEWAADITYAGESFGMYHVDRWVEAWFPRRPDLCKPGEEIDAALHVHAPIQWPNLDKSITKESALRIIFAMAIADSIHEVAEKVCFDGDHVLAPHPENEDPMWATILSVAAEAAIRLLKEHPRND